MLGPAAARSAVPRVLVAASGRMGRIRAGLVQASPRLQLCGIVDPISNAQAAELAETYGVNAYADLREAIEDNTSRNGAPPVDGVLISSPTLTHGDVIREAANHKLAVFVEKPVAETTQDIASLFQYADTADIPLCCSFQRRFDPSYVAATRAVQSGQIGKPVLAHLFFADHPVPPREFMRSTGGSNIFLDLAAHDVDYILFTLQQTVESVYAVGTSSTEELRAAGVHDNATLVLHFSQGTSTATLFLSRSTAVYGYDQRCEILGSEGLVSVQNVPEHTTVVRNAQGSHQARLQHSFPERFHEAFRLELEAFADVMLARRSGGSSSACWPVTRAQCVAVQRVVDAARQSAETGQVVRIDHS